MAQAYRKKRKTKKKYYETNNQRPMIQKKKQKWSTTLDTDTLVSTLKHILWKTKSTLEICHVENDSPYKRHSHKALHSVRKESQSFLLPETACIATIWGQNSFQASVWFHKKSLRWKVAFLFAFGLKISTLLNSKSLLILKIKSSFLSVFCPQYH